MYVESMESKTLISDGNVWELEIWHESSPRYVIPKNTKVFLSRQYFFVIITTQTFVKQPNKLHSLF